MSWLARRSGLLPWLALGLLLALLGVLAVLQFRWLGEAARADRLRTAASLRAGAVDFARDAERELIRPVLELLPEIVRSDGWHGDENQLAAALAAGRQRWRWTAPDPELLASIEVLMPLPDGKGAHLSLRPNGRLEPHAGGPLASLWSDGGVSAWSGLAGRRLRSRLLGVRLVDDAPVLVLPMGGARSGPREEVDATVDGDEDELPDANRNANPERFARRWLRSRTRGRAGGGLLVVRLDGDAVRGRLLPELANRHFRTGDGELGASVRLRVDGTAWWSIGGAEPVEATNVRSTPGPPPDVVVSLFDRGPDARASPRLGPPSGRLRPMALGPPAAAWSLEVNHPSGSLDVAVRRARRGSFALGLAILALLGLAAVFLALGAARARALAARQLDFVAGMTHELLTPLAALRSAGQNLADGVVNDPAQVARYGELVEREGRRLSDLVQQVLAFAGVSSRQLRYRPQPVALAAAVRDVLAALGPAIEAANVAVDVDVSADLPAVEVDREGLDRALSNLIANALKHGQSEDGSGWLRIAAARRGGRIAVEVVDRGPGLDPRDRGRIFEPFVRGRGKTASATPGGGLGLALVHHFAVGHRGRVRVGPGADGRGVTFTLELPIAAAVGAFSEA